MVANDPSKQLLLFERAMVHVPGPGCQRLCSRCRCIPRRRWGRSQRDLNKMQVRVELFCVFLLPRGRHGGGEHRLLTGAKDAVFGEHAVWSFCPQFSAGAYTVGEGGTGTGLPGWLRVKIKNVWNHQLDIPVSYVSLPKGISPCIYIYQYLYIYMNIILQPKESILHHPGVLLVSPASKAWPSLKNSTKEWAWRRSHGRV